MWPGERVPLYGHGAAAPHLEMRRLYDHLLLGLRPTSQHQIGYVPTWARGIPIVQAIVGFICIRGSHWAEVVMGSLKEEYFHFPRSYRS